MSVPSLAVRESHPRDRQLGAAQWPALRVESWQHDPGVKEIHTASCTDVAIILSGRCLVKRTGNGQTQEGLGQAGSIWLCPTSTYESHVEVVGSTVECLHLLLPASLLEQSALINYDIDPAKVHLAYAGGFADPMILQIGSAFSTLLDRGAQPTDRLLVDGLQQALAARLLANYAVDTWQEPARADFRPKTTQACA